MRHMLDVLPGAVLPDPVAESADPGAPLAPPDDDDLLRPRIEEELFRVGARGSLVGAQPTALAKHLVWTFGPVHRALPFPLQLRVELDGGRLVTVDPEVGFLHQGLEKALEQVSFRAGFEVIARASPLSPVGYQLCWALAVERLCGVAERVPKRAQLWRVAVLELARVADHLAVLAQPALAPASARLRRALAEVARDARGLVDGLARSGAFAGIGGLARPLHDDEATRIARALPRVLEVVRGVQNALTESAALDAHLEGLGRITRQEALSLSLTGPALRATGVADDLRKSEPVFAYDDLPVEAAVAHGGCARCRGRVRLEEILFGGDVALRALDRLSSAPPEIALDDGALKEPLATPAGVAAASLELASGELSVIVVSDGTDKPRRARVRGPSSALAAALPEILVGDRIDDVIPVLQGLGLTGTEVDR
ncbi:MAG: NADH-quinone oxidoreductase subunit D [Deltaproteobacteria bacterium]|nr:NADH-quinone oxidoreductase subunit D [Deltaproteobacteria bacterium]